MKQFNTIIDRIVDSRAEEVAWLVAVDPEVVKAQAEYDAITRKIQAATDFETSDDLMSAVNNYLGRDQDAAYKIGFMDGMKFFFELNDLETDHMQIMLNFKNGLGSHTDEEV